MNRSIIIPAKNEAESLVTLLPEIKLQQPNAEIVVVNDGSTDDTQKICEAEGVVVVSHPYSKGNGAAIKSGARAATGDVLVFRYLVYKTTEKTVGTSSTVNIVLEEGGT